MLRQRFEPLTRNMWPGVPNEPISGSIKPEQSSTVDLRRLLEAKTRGSHRIGGIHLIPETFGGPSLLKRMTEAADFITTVSEL